MSERKEDQTSEAPRLTVASLRRALARHPLLQIPALPGRRNHLPAGVLVPVDFARDPDRPAVILTERTAQLRRHAGEICFPGGRPDPGDADLRATALREAREELGLDRVDLLGQLSAMPVYTSDFRLCPFVASVPAGQVMRRAADEVQRVLRLDLLEVLDAPQIEGIPFTLGGLEMLSPIFRLEGALMFGATAHTFFELLAVAAGVVRRRLPRLRASELSWGDLRPDP